MWRYVELFRKYGLPVIGGTTLVAGAVEFAQSLVLSLASVDQAASRDRLDLSCYLGLAAILCAVGYFALPQLPSNPAELKQN